MGAHWNTSWNHLKQTAVVSELGMAIEAFATAFWAQPQLFTLSVHCLSLLFEFTWHTSRGGGANSRLHTGPSDHHLLQEDTKCIDKIPAWDE